MRMAALIAMLAGCGFSPPSSAVRSGDDPMVDARPLDARPHDAGIPSDGGALPATCIAAGAGSDSTVTLYVVGNADQPWTAFCHAGLEYLAVSGSNFGQYTQSMKSPGTNVRTTYTKLRIDPVDLEVDICDQTFATSTGSLRHDPANNPNLPPVTSMPVGVAMDCGGNKSASGAANVDVSGTPFAISSTWKPGGNKTGGNTMPSSNGRALAITGGGDCGWNAPNGSPGNPFNTFTPSNLIKLQYLP